MNISHPLSKGNPMKWNLFAAMAIAMVCAPVIAAPIGVADLAYIADDGVGTFENTPWSGYALGIGHVFTVNSTLTVDQLGMVTNNAIGQTTQMYRLNDPTGDLSDATLLGTTTIPGTVSTTVSNFGPGGFFGLFLNDPDTAITLVPGETYVVAAYGFDGVGNAGVYIDMLAAALSSTPYAQQTVASEVNQIASRFGAGGINSVPDTADSSLKYNGPTFTFSVVDIPTPVALPAGLALIGLAATRRTTRLTTGRRKA